MPRPGTRAGESAAPPLFEVWKKAKQERDAKRGGVILTLPSGLPVRVARMPLLALIQRGQIPDALAPVIRRYIEDIDRQLEPDKHHQRTDEVVQQAVARDPVQAFADYKAILEFVFTSCVIEPRFIRHGDEDRFVPAPGQDAPLYVDYGPDGSEPDVTGDDLQYVYNFCQGVDQTVEEYFREQAALMGDLADMQDVSS